MNVHLSSFLFLGAMAATASCSGQYQVGTDPGAGGAGGGTSTGSSSTGGATVGASSSTGSTTASSSASTSGTSATTGTSVTTGGGSTPAGTGGQGGAPPQPDAAVSRCNFASDTNGSSSGPNASGTIVASRIHLFLDDDPTAPALIPPPPPDAAAWTIAPWAMAEAMAVLDAHRANGTQAAGLVRFLTNWLAVPLPEAGTSAARTWALTLIDPNATLSTLLAGPTADPRRSGVLTDRQWLTAHPRISLRGQWMAANLFCNPVPPPPVDSPMLTPPGMNQTRRENLAQQIAPPSCVACHNYMDPPGFSLEHFDAMGNYSDLDNGKAVDSSGRMEQLMLSFNSIEDLAPKLAASCEVALCFTSELMNDAFVVSPTAQAKPFTEAEANRVANDFANSNFSIRALVQSIVGSPAFLR